MQNVKNMGVPSHREESGQGAVPLPETFVVQNEFFVQKIFGDQAKWGGGISQCLGIDRSRQCPLNTPLPRDLSMHS